MRCSYGKDQLRDVEESIVEQLGAGESQIRLILA